MFPPGRYGRRRESRRHGWGARIALAVLVVVCLAVAYKLYRQYGDEQYTPTVIKDPATDTSMTVEFRVQKPDAPAVCTVQAFAYSGAKVGEAQVPVGTGTDVTVTYRLATTAKAYVAEIPSCQAAPSRTQR